MSKVFKNIGYILIISSLYSPSLYAYRTFYVYRKTQENTIPLDFQKKNQRKKTRPALSWFSNIRKNKTTLLAILIPSVLFIGVVGIGRYFLAKEEKKIHFLAKEEKNQRQKQIQFKKAANQVHRKDLEEDILSISLWLQSRKENKRCYDRPRQTQEKLQKKPQVQKPDESQQTQPELQKKLQEEKDPRYYSEQVTQKAKQQSIHEMLRQLVEATPRSARK